MNNIHDKISVIILCGGKGERLRPLTSKAPKPLIKIYNKPILSHLIHYLEKFGFKDFIIGAGYKSDQIYKYFKNNHKLLNVKIIDSGDVDILTRLIDCKKTTNNNIILCYGDTLADINFHKYIKFHKTHKKNTSVVSYQLRSKFGILDINNNNLVKSFIEKPLLNQTMVYATLESDFHLGKKGLINVRDLTDAWEMLEY